MISTNERNIMYDWSNFLQPQDRCHLSKKLLNQWWMNHEVLFINSFQDYEQIESWISRSSSHDKIILQIEEDWFFKSDWQQIRSKIKNHPNWTDRDFVITSSRLDFEKTKQMGINSLFRPALLDMICFYPYDTTTVGLDLEKINRHTGALYSHSCPARHRIIQHLLQYPQRLSAILHPGVQINNTGIENDFISTWNLAPWVNISVDRSWASRSAFCLAIETMWESQWAPNLSEKTFKAIHLLRPALIFGGRGTKLYLERLGFDTWDWFIDWSWDVMPDGEERFNAFLAEIDRLMSTPITSLTSLIEKNQNSLLHNRKRLQQLIENFHTLDL